MSIMNFRAKVEMAQEGYRLWIQEFLQKYETAGHAALIEEIPGISALAILLADADNMTEEEIDNIREATTEALTRAMISVATAEPLGLEKIKAIADAHLKSKEPVN